MIVEYPRAGRIGRTGVPDRITMKTFSGRIPSILGFGFPLPAAFSHGGIPAKQFDVMKPADVAHEGDRPLPQELSLSDNHPDPFNSPTSIELSLPSGGRVGLIVRDAPGREVAPPGSAVSPPGIHTALWNPGVMPSGAYFCTLNAGSVSRTTKAVLIR